MGIQLPRASRTRAKHIRQDPAVQVALELLAHVGGEPAAAAPAGGALEEGRQALLDHAIEDRLLGLAPPVRRRDPAHAGEQRKKRACGIRARSRSEDSAAFCFVGEYPGRSGDSNPYGFGGVRMALLEWEAWKTPERVRSIESRVKGLTT